MMAHLPDFPLFRPLSLEDKPLLDSAFQQFPPTNSEFTFTNLFIWRHAYHIKISRLQQFICLFAEKGDHPFFFPPIGEGEMITCCRILLQSMRQKGISSRLARMPEEILSRFDWESEGFEVMLDRDQSDYIYLIEDLVQLRGRKYHRKRNHIKKFKETYPYEYRPLVPELIAECLDLQAAWCDLKQCDLDPSLTNEFIAIKEAFTHFDVLGVKGGAILIEGRVEAFTLGEPLNRDTIVIHIEKANPNFDGLYPTLNQAFLEHHWTGYQFVNREQDLGEEGLRKAKESYFPHHLVNKYVLTLKG